MKKLTFLIVFLTLNLFANNNNPSIKKKESKKIISQDCNGNITFSDTPNEVLEEIYFYDTNNIIVKGINHINENSDFEILDWKKIHHIIIITDKKTYRINTQQINL